MDEDMWHHPATKRNLEQLSAFGHSVIPSEHGELASGLIGMGRMAEPETILKALSVFFQQKDRLKGRKALVTAGPTFENIDPVRFIGNHSSGKMGIAIAEELANNGCEVELVLGPVHENTTHPGIHITPVKNAAEMFGACSRLFPDMNIAVMSAAVADYTPVEISDTKIKKKEEDMVIRLKKTTDILHYLGQHKQERQLLVGFALESNNETDYALKKLQEKNADMIVLNSLNDKGAGFSYDTNKITIFEKSGKQTSYELKSKKEVARDIVEKIIEQAG